MDLYDFARSLGFEVVVAGRARIPRRLRHARLGRRGGRAQADEPEDARRLRGRDEDDGRDGRRRERVGFHPDVPNMHGPKETVPNRLGSLFSLKGEGGILSYGVVDYVRGVAPGVFVIVRSGAEPVRETMEYLGMGGPNHVFYRPYHLTSLETPISVARAAIYGEPTIISQDRPVAEVVAVAKRTCRRGRSSAASARLTTTGALPVLGGRDAPAGPRSRSAHHTTRRER